MVSTYNKMLITQSNIVVSSCNMNIWYEWFVQLLQLNVNKCIAKSFCTIRDNELSMRSFNLSQSMWYIILICFVSISRPELLIETLPDAEEELVSCNLPSGETSHCVSLKTCKSVNALLDNLPEPRSEIVEEYIKESFFCPTKRSSDIEDQVCCPFDGVVNPKPEKSKPFWYFSVNNRNDLHLN